MIRVGTCGGLSDVAIGLLEITAIIDLQCF
jgi:uridine phosphorylase